MQNNFEAIVVLGYGQKEKQIDEILKNRLEKALEIFQENKEAKIILSGGKVLSKDFSEAEIMAEFLKERGVPETSIILEDKSRNTFENLINLKEIIKEKGFQKVALITSDYHLKRVEMIAKNINLKIFGFPSFSKKDIKFRFKKLITEFFKKIFDYLRTIWAK